MITVSRSDIVYDRIIESCDPRRFLKIPIEPYLNLLSVVPIPSQIALINAVNMPKYRFICAALSRRQGKTYIANIIGQLVSLVPNANILIMSPNYSLSQISFELQRQLIRYFDIEVEKDNAKDKVITISNGSNIRMGSVSQVDSCVGRSYDLIIFDEAALADGEDAFNVALRPTLDKPGAKAIFISTPRGKANWFSRFYDRGFSPDFPAWCSIKATWEDNPRISMEDIAEARKTMSKAEFAQEYECSFNTYEGKIWDLAPNCTAKLDTLDCSKLDMIMGLDVGFRDATAAVVVAYSWETDCFYVVDEYSSSENTTAGHATAIKAMMDKWGVDFGFIDSAAQQTKYDFAQMYDISCNNAKKSVLDGVGFLGSLFDNNKILVCSSCTQTISSIDQYQWDNRVGAGKEKPKHGAASHLCDALRYAIYSFETGMGSL